MIFFNLLQSLLERALKFSMFLQLFQFLMRHTVSGWEGSTPHPLKNTGDYYRPYNYILLLLIPTKLDLCASYMPIIPHKKGQWLRARRAASQADHISETKGLQLFLQTDRYMGGYFNEFLPHSDVCLLSNWFSYIGIYYILYDYISVATDAVMNYISIF